MKSKIIKFWLPVFFWAGVIFGLSSIPSLPKVGFIWWDFVMKKSAHMFVYAVLFYLLIRALRASSQNISKKEAFWLAILIGILYAISDEFHQSFVPGRTPHVMDVGFDTLGMMVSRWIIQKRKLL